MARVRGFVATLLVTVGAALGAPPVAADPVAGNRSASDTIDELKAQGYDVKINWINGSRNGSLADCSVSAIHNPNRSGEPPTTFTTVYVDVACPGDMDVGIGLGTNEFGFPWGIGLW